VSRLTYASSAWSGFITATDRQRVNAFLSRSKRCGFCPPDLPNFDPLLEEADDQLFERILNNPQHTLYQYFHYNPQYHRSITSDAARMTDNCMNTKDTRVTVTLLRGYCTKSHTNSMIYIVYCKL